jgi:hypothetical protein
VVAQEEEGCGRLIEQIKILQKFCAAIYARVAELVLGSPPPEPPGWLMAPHRDRRLRQLSSARARNAITANIPAPTQLSCDFTGLIDRVESGQSTLAYCWID